MWHLKFDISCSMFCVKRRVHLGLFAKRQMPTSLNYHGTLQKLLLMSLKFSEASKSPLVRPAHCNKAQKIKRHATKMFRDLLLTLLSALVTLVIQFSTCHQRCIQCWLRLYKQQGVWRLPARLLLKNRDTLAKQHE